MNTYLKTICIAVTAVALSAAVAARPAEPDAVVLPTPLVTGLLQYLNNRPYQEVAGIMANLQRCLQDQVPDAKGVVAERGGCSEIAKDLQQMKTPLSQKPSKAP